MIVYHDRLPILFPGFHLRVLSSSLSRGNWLYKRHSRSDSSVEVSSRFFFTKTTKGIEMWFV